MDITDIDRSPELVVYRLAKGALLEFKRVHFPINTHVIVNCPGRYVGPGITEAWSEGQPDEVAVRLPNQNVWHYRMETVKPITPAAIHLPNTTPPPPRTLSASGGEGRGEVVRSNTL